MRLPTQRLRLGIVLAGSATNSNSESEPELVLESSILSNLRLAAPPANLNPLPAAASGQPGPTKLDTYIPRPRAPAPAAA